MKQAKPTDEDIQKSIELTVAIDGLSSWGAVVPDAISFEPELGEFFDINNNDQCSRVLKYLIDLSSGSSLNRVVFSCAIMANPKNELIDPNRDTLEFHPKIESMRLAERIHKENSSSQFERDVFIDAACEKAWDNFQFDQQPDDSSGWIKQHERGSRIFYVNPPDGVQKDSERCVFSIHFDAESKTILSVSAKNSRNHSMGFMEESLIDSINEELRDGKAPEIGA